MPMVLAIMPAVQWVVSPGGSWAVRATTRSMISASSRARPGGRVLSRSRPSTPSCMNRSCQRHTTDLLRPVPRLMALVPSPSAVNKMMLARQTCFCGLFRFATTASSRARSAVVTSTTIPLRMPQTRTTRASRESSAGLARQIACTSRAPLSEDILGALYLKGNGSFFGEGFRMPARRDLSSRTGCRRPKAPQEGTRGGPCERLPSMGI